VDYDVSAFVELFDKLLVFCEIPTSARSACGEDSNGLTWSFMQSIDGIGLPESAKNHISHRSLFEVALLLTPRLQA